MLHELLHEVIINSHEINIPSSCEPLHWLGISEWALLVRPATVANFPGPGGGGPPPPIGPAGFLPVYKHF